MRWEVVVEWGWSERKRVRGGEAEETTEFVSARREDRSDPIDDVEDITAEKRPRSSADPVPEDQHMGRRPLMRGRRGRSAVDEFGEG